MASRTRAIWDDAFTAYNFGRDHPMAPVRLDLTTRLARALGVLDDVEVVAPDSFRLALPLVIERFNEVNPEVEVTVRFGSSPAQALELADGASGDVFISDSQSMNALVTAGRTDGPPRELVRENTVIVTAAGSTGIRSVASLTGVRVATCEATMPCGIGADAVAL